jgi:hypothetical protein
MTDFLHVIALKVVQYAAKSTRFAVVFSSLAKSK